jgi:hypothetical protein
VRSRISSCLRTNRLADVRESCRTQPGHPHALALASRQTLCSPASTPFHAICSECVESCIVTCGRWLVSPEPVVALAAAPLPGHSSSLLWEADINVAELVRSPARLAVGGGCVLVSVGEEIRGENVLLGSKREFSLQDALQPRRVSDSMPPAPLFLCSNLDGYQKLFEQYLAEAKSKIDWKKCNPPPEGMVRVCNQTHILQRFVVVPLPSSLAVLFRGAKSMHHGREGRVFASPLAPQQSAQLR